MRTTIAIVSLTASTSVVAQQSAARMCQMWALQAETGICPPGMNESDCATLLGLPNNIADVCSASSPEEYLQQSTRQTAPASQTVGSDIGMIPPFASTLVGSASHCSLGDVARPYDMGFVDLDCQVAGRWLQCCEVERSLFFRPEDTSSFDPLNPPQRLPTIEEAGYRAPNRDCGGRGLILVLQGDEAVGFSGLDPASGQQREVRLPIDNTCRLTSGTISEPEETLAVRFDPSRADVKRNEPEIQYEIGEYWSDRGRTRLAITHFTAAAREGHAQSQYELGLIFEQGDDSLRRNLAEADRLFGMASSQGLDAARLKVEARDEQLERFALLVQEAEADDADTQYVLANLYRAGEIVDLDWDRTVYWLQRASDLDHGPAKSLLGLIYARGVFGLVERDDARARALLEESIDLGYDWALVNLARVTYSGEQDIATDAESRARELLNRARQSSDQEVVQAANLELNYLDRDRSVVARRNTIEARREQIDAMIDGFNSVAGSALDALQDVR